MIDIYYVGRKGEDITVDFLKKLGFFIFKRNYSCRFGEIDIIAEKDDLLLFVEVKTRFEDFMVSPEEAVDVLKQKRIKHTARDFISKLHREYRYRFDVSAVTVRAENGEYKFSLNYIKNAFE